VPLPVVERRLQLGGLGQRAEVDELVGVVLLDVGDKADLDPLDVIEAAAGCQPGLQLGPVVGRLLDVVLLDRDVRAQLVVRVVQPGLLEAEGAEQADRQRDRVAGAALAGERVSRAAAAAGRFLAGRAGSREQCRRRDNTRHPYRSGVAVPHSVPPDEQAREGVRALSRAWLGWGTVAAMSRVGARFARSSGRIVTRT